ncbi:TolC family protein [Pontibacter sp. JH31]|uniref:TolC family protein n=1 Tax=Pontibacter aquaedesilientis TaxID=2766980 RepID=A0ABR7XET7_9BACT|nr:TolC family protein [Pontibacter aquaedesilientis]MBD1396133.1 TolC family protein [Pontibacter aquaedesilientis]
MKKMSNKVLLLALGLTIGGYSTSLAQQQGAGSDGIWSLEEAVNYAKTNNLNVRQSSLNRELEQADLNQSRASRLPSINANGNYSFNTGSFQDPVTFSLLTQNARTSNVSINATLPLFAGFQQVNQIKQNSLNLEASEQDYLSAQNDITVQIVTAYLNILFANEQMNVSDLQRNLTREQLKRTNILFNAGSVAENAVLDIESQLATDELNYITAQNQRDISRLTLMQLLNIPTSEDFQIEIPKIPEPDENPVIVDGSQVYDVALQTLPAIRATDLRLRSAERGIDLARGAYYPRLSLFAGAGSRYASTSRKLVALEQVNVGRVPQVVYYDAAGSESDIIYFDQFSTRRIDEHYGMFSQWDDNLNTQFGLSLQIPILNSLQVRTNVQRAKLQHQNAKLNADIARNNLRQTIEQAYVDAIAAQRRYAASLQQVNASEKNFRNAELRLQNGVINSVDFNIIANTYRSAQSSLIQAKYDYTFKLKILDFYQGKDLSF